MPSVIPVFAVFLFRQFFKALPDDLVHAARIDGMNGLSIVWRVVMPNAPPAATAFAIFSVVAHVSHLRSASGRACAGLSGGDPSTHSGAARQEPWRAPRYLVRMDSGVWLTNDRQS